jgi:uroporphyrinogen decarboxylase
MGNMTSRERLLTAIRNQVPDRVPAAPDISVMIPTKRTGLAFWEVLFEEKVPLWQAYLDAADHFGLDAWTAAVMFLPVVCEESAGESQTELRLDSSRDAMVQTTTVKTPDGDLTQQDVCFRENPPATTEKLIKDLTRDFRKFKHTQPMPKALDLDMLETLRQACLKRDYAFGVCITYPGFHMWNCYVETGIEALAYAEMDTPEILEEWLEWDLERGTVLMELALQANLDYLLFGGSGTITMASPDLAAKYAIPALKKWSGMAKDAGLPTMLHSCGKSRVLADMLVAETDVGMLNPLEVPPMGDVDLAELKRAHGHRLATMGNLHTTDVMLAGSPAFVKQKAFEAMRVAGQGGGFILSTGDQCGRDTPDENLYALVETAHEYGVYDQTTGRLRDQ